MGIFSNSLFYDIVTVFIAVFVSLITFFKWRYKYWDRKGVPTALPSPAIPFGHIKDLFTQKRHTANIFEDFYVEAKAKGYRHIGIFILARPVYIPVDPEIAKHIMVKDFNSFSDRRAYHNERDDPLSAHLFSVEAEKWKSLRQKLTPTFTTGQLKYMFATLMDCAKNLESYVDEHINETLDIKEILARFSTDVIASCAFGLDCNTLKNPDSDFRKYGKLVFENSRTAAFKVLLETIVPHDVLRFVRFKIIRTDVTKFFMKIVKEMIHYRETNNVHRKDFMDLLLQLKNKGTLEEEGQMNGNKAKGNSVTLTVNEIAAQSMLFYAAGFETSSTTTNYALFELSQNQDLQDKAREEIHSVLEQHDGKLTYDAVMEMQNLANVVDETLRKYPPGSILSRISNKAYKIPDSNVVLDKGTEIAIPVMGLHRDPEYYPDPEKFDPDRFTPENKKTRPSCVYLPFGDGPRNCIGLRFGLMQSRVGLACLLNKFKFTLNSKTQLPIVFDPTTPIITPKNDIWLNASKIDS